MAILWKGGVTNTRRLEELQMNRWEMAPMAIEEVRQLRMACGVGLNYTNDYNLRGEQIMRQEKQIFFVPADLGKALVCTSVPSLYGAKIEAIQSA
jgi:hypothetical protein